VTGKDVAFLRATLLDSWGTPVAEGWENVFFGATGGVELMGANPFSSEAGIASILVQAEAPQPRAAVYALALVGEGERVRALSDGLSVGGDVRPWVVRVTTDGSEPGADDPAYGAPVRAGGRVRAALFVDGTRVVEADSDAPKFRIPGSKAPEDAR